MSKKSLTFLFSIGILALWQSAQAGQVFCPEYLTCTNGVCNTSQNNGYDGSWEIIVTPPISKPVQYDFIQVRSDPVNHSMICVYVDEAQQYGMTQITNNKPYFEYSDDSSWTQDASGKYCGTKSGYPSNTSTYRCPFISIAPTK